MERKIHSSVDRLCQIDDGVVEDDRPVLVEGGGGN